MFNIIQHWLCVSFISHFDKEKESEYSLDVAVIDHGVTQTCMYNFLFFFLEVTKFSLFNKQNPFYITIDFLSVNTSKIN